MSINVLAPFVKASVDGEQIVGTTAMTRELGGPRIGSELGMHFSFRVHYQHVMIRAFGVKFLETKDDQCGFLFRGGGKLSEREFTEVELMGKSSRRYMRCVVHSC